MPVRETATAEGAEWRTGEQVRARRMNHLAHIVLSGEEPRMQVGGLLGDFWRGTLPPEWPEALTCGVLLHRHVDTWTDANPVLARTRALFPPPYRRYAGILLDVWFDHLLARGFNRLAGMRLEEVAQRAYTAFRSETTALPAAFTLFAARLEKQRGLERSVDLDYIESVLERIAMRLARSNPVASALPVLESLATPVARAFEEFWPELARFAQAERARLAETVGSGAGAQ